VINRKPRAAAPVVSRESEQAVDAPR
jgi:hypothetical protein